MPTTGLNLAAWEDELAGDIDREFLLTGVRNGFEIIDHDTTLASAKCNNHPSASPHSPLYQKATEQVLSEIESGNYVVCKEEPLIISPMAAIPKRDGGVRLIHDCSRPIGSSVNDHCSADWHQKFARIDDAADLMSPGCYFAKVDLKSAYRSVSIGKHSQTVTGFKWNIQGENVTLRDTKLPFGAKLAPGIFHRITQAVKRMMARRGYNQLVVYLDDFLIVSESLETCAEALQCLILLLRKLGFAIHWGKVVDPTTKIVFLGIELDSVKMTLSLPEDKLGQLTAELRTFMSRKRVSKRQLQSLAGRLSWAAGVVRGGRVFLRRMFTQISMLKHNTHRTVLSHMVQQDLRWWYEFLRTFNGRSTLLDQKPIDCVFTDACTDAAGGVFMGDWFYLNWNVDWPEVSMLHINEKEVLAVVLAAQRWAHLWGNKHVILHSDNMVTVSAINKGTCRNSMVMKSLRYLFWLSALHNFHMTAKHIAGVSNWVADSASRIHDRGHLQTLLPYTTPSPLWAHMTLPSFCFLLDRLRPRGVG